ncbi:MAG: Co2+/Mg2+ efflux protein ApaG [Brevundimonas sp.]|uniref:Co2+/Mg2+ efflux protein ApaG n=1 Tax=Brevundimonas sp. TaxID=1871086 RepID=UPI00391D648D
MHDTPAYEAETDGVLVRVRPSYLAGQSDPEAGRWVWAYQVEIVNLTSEAIQLIARRWVITDAQGRVEEVRGEGVVGEQPVIKPGASYTYASGCPLGAPSGSMVGGYAMTDASGRAFEAAIPAFSLDVPGERRVLN